MKKKSAFLLGTSIVTLIVASGAWILTSVPSRAVQYIEESPNVLPVLASMNFIQIRDMPGYAGALGRHDAKDAALEAINIENAAWSEMEFVGYELTSKTILARCVAEVHERKVNFLKRSAYFATQTLVEMSDVDRLLKDEKALAALEDKCSELAIEATKWKGRLWAKTISLFESTTTSNQVKSEVDLENTRGELTSPPKQNTPTAAATASSSTDNPKVLGFKELKKVDFAKLTEDQKAFLRKLEIPTRDDDVFEGASSAVYKPAIIKANKTGNTLLIASTSESSGDSGAVFFSVYDIDKLAEVPLKGFDEEFGVRSASYVSFEVSGDSLVGLLKVNTEQFGNSRDGLAKCSNSGVKVRLTAEEVAFDKPIIKNLGTECPVLKKNPQSSMDIAEYNNAQNEVFIKSLFEKLANPSAVITVSATQNALPLEIVNECKRGLKEYLVSQYGSFTKANELAVNENCNAVPKEWLCFVNKVKDWGGDVSRADQGNFEYECGLR